ncbi:MAG: hypothetical protein RLZZ272_1041 [Actinomycetota bacterium]
MPDHPSTPPPSTELERALATVHELLDAIGPDLVAVAGTIAMELKGDGTPVTELDHETDRRLSEGLLAAFPTHEIVSEERTTTSSGATWTWVIDPIDGTSNFISGLPHWGTSVALCREGEPVLGVVDAPAMGRRWAAIAGGGARRDGQRVAVRSDVDWDDPSRAHVPVLLTSTAARRIAGSRLACNPRLLGAVALDLALVAEGTASASVAWVPHVWDVAAGVVLVTEAGGAVTQRGDTPLLPLTGGVDHARRTALVGGGADAASLARLVDELWER